MGRSARTLEELQVQRLEAEEAEQRRVDSLESQVEAARRDLDRLHLSQGQMTGKEWGCPFNYGIILILSCRSFA
jgi:hypothetical protein